MWCWEVTGQWDGFPQGPGRAPASEHLSHSSQDLVTKWPGQSTADSGGSQAYKSILLGFLLKLLLQLPNLGFQG